MRVVICRRDADADPSGELAAVQREWLPEGSEDTSGKRGQVELGRRIELGANSEFVAPQASCRVVLAQTPHESNADFDKERITYRMTEGVVHELEVFQVDQEYSDQCPPSLYSAQRLIDAIVEQHTVCEVSKTVV